MNAPHQFPDPSPSREGMADLAARVEAADGPSRELFLQVEQAFGRAPTDAWPHSNGTDWWANGKDWGHIPDYFGSLDAAMSLVPEGFGYTAATNPDDTSRHFWGIWHPDREQSFEGEAATPALALCAAALRARAAQ